MEVKETVEKAWSDVQGASIPEALKEIAFRKVLEHDLGGSINSHDAPTVVRTSASTTPSGKKGSGVHEPNFFSTLARETNVAQDKLEELFYVDGDGEPHINIAARRLGSSRAERVRVAGVFVAASRHYWLNELEISVSSVRDECISMNSYDANNFSSDVSETPGLNYSGPRGKKVLRPKSDLAKVFANKVGAVLGEDGEV